MLRQNKMNTDTFEQHNKKVCSSFIEPKCSYHLLTLLKRPDMSNKRIIDLIEKCISEGIEVLNDDDISELFTCFGLHPSCKITVGASAFGAAILPEFNHKVFKVYPPVNGICDSGIELNVYCDGPQWAIIPPI